MLKAALRDLQVDSVGPANSVQLVSDIIISHWHGDHVGGIPTVLKLLHDLWVEDSQGSGASSNLPYHPPKLHKYPIPTGSDGEHATAEWNSLPKIVKEVARYEERLFSPTFEGGLFHPLVDSQVFRVGSPSLGKSGQTLLKILHTPGHTVDSISIYIPADKALYTADTVLGHGTAVFEDLATYLASLNKMLKFGSGSSSSQSISPSTPQSSADDQETWVDHDGEPIDLAYVSLYPAHGQVVAQGRELISTYIKHRLEREAQILSVLKSEVPEEFREEGVVSSVDGGEDGKTYWTTWTLVKTIYKSYPESLWLPAARGVMLHMKKLEGEGTVKRVGSGEGKDIRWDITPSDGRRVAFL